MERTVLWKGKKVERTVNSGPFSQKLQTQVSVHIEQGRIMVLSVEVFGAEDKVAMNLGRGALFREGFELLGAYRAFKLVERLPTLSKDDVRNILRLAVLPPEVTAAIRKKVEPLFPEQGMLDALLKSVPPDLASLLANLDKQGVEVDINTLCMALDAGLIKPSQELSDAGVRPKDERDLMMKGLDTLEARFLPHIQAMFHVSSCTSQILKSAVNAYLAGYDDTDICVGIAVAVHLMGPDLSEFESHPFLGGLARELTSIFKEVSGTDENFYITADFLAKEFSSKGISAEAYLSLLSDLVPKFRALKTIPTDRLKTVQQ